MRAMFTGAALAIAVMITPVAAAAQERAGDAALGALSGAVVLGPVGAVAGAVVGYTMGPSIAHAWGVKRAKGRQHPKSWRAAAPGRRAITARSNRPSVQSAAKQGGEGIPT